MAKGKMPSIALVFGHRGGESEESEAEERDGGKGNEEGLMAAAEDLLAAVDSKSADGVAEALRNAFAILDSMPHEEGEHEDEE